MLKGKVALVTGAWNWSRDCIDLAKQGKCSSKLCR